MRISIRVESPTTPNDSHCRLTLFTDGGNSGTLTLREQDVTSFISIVERGCAAAGHAFKLNGAVWSSRTTAREQS